MNDDVIETGFWCEAEGIYFTEIGEHLSELAWLRSGQRGPLGHYGHECEGRAETVRVAIVRLEEARHRRPRIFLNRLT